MLYLLLYLAAWGIVHSWLASLGVKAHVRRLFGEGGARAYRLIYNIFSVISFAPIVLLMRISPDRLLYAAHGAWLYLMLAGQALALVGLVVTLLHTDTLSFIGLRQLVSRETEPRLVIEGLYRWVRHPLYLFGLLLLWLTPVMSVNLLVAYLGLSAYLIIGAYFEERKLLREFGAAYAEYKARTPMIVPLRLPSK